MCWSDPAERTWRPSVTISSEASRYRRTSRVKKGLPLVRRHKASANSGVGAAPAQAATRRSVSAGFMSPTAYS